MRASTWILTLSTASALGVGILAWMATSEIPRSHAAPTAPGAAVAATSAPSDADRAVAVGLLLDAPRPIDAIDRGLRVADGLRRLYGLDSGNRFADREEAALRASSELLERLQFGDREVAEMAASLGYSLDPEGCANTCENVRNLAVLELKKLALEAAAEGREIPGQLAAVALPEGAGRGTRPGEIESRSLQ